MASKKLYQEKLRTTKQLLQYCMYLHDHANKAQFFVVCM